MDTRTVANGMHTLSASARDVTGSVGFSAPVSVNVANASHFQNEILATGFDLPTTMAFLPDGKMLVGELGGTIRWCCRRIPRSNQLPSCRSPTSAGTA
jgi:glucose/arabinose dehydrogenase